MSAPSQIGPGLDHRGCVVAILAAIVVVAAGLRGYQLGRLSFWYDEVVTMRLARRRRAAGLIRTLVRIDATRAPLHPLLLQGWIAGFRVVGGRRAGIRACSAASRRCAGLRHRPGRL